MALRAAAPYADRQRGALTSFDSGVVAGPAAAGPLRSVPSPVRVDDDLVVEVLAAVAGASGSTGVAQSALPPLLEVEGVRAAAAVVRAGSNVLVLASAGYDCGSMAPGATLPLDAGLPVTQAVRTARAVLQGTGPGWVAVPFGRGRDTGALLLSFAGPPPQTAVEVARLTRIARAVGDALHRERRHEDALAELDVVTARLATRDAGDAGCDVTTRSVPYAGAVGGDSVLCLSDGRGGHWLLAADVCGSGLPAAVTGRTVEAALVALAPYVETAADLLTAADRSIRTAIGAESFVTAVVVRAAHRRLDVASAGHPLPLLLTSAAVRHLEVEPGLPLALDTDAPVARRSASVPMPDDAVLLLYTDGLTDRRGLDGPRPADALQLAEGLPLDDLEAAADALLQAADAVGAASDDVSVLLARLEP